MTTLNELEMVSEITEAQKPINANRNNHQMMGCLDGSFRISDRKLYY